MANSGRNFAWVKGVASELPLIDTLRLAAGSASLIWQTGTRWWVAKEKYAEGKSDFVGAKQPLKLAARWRQT